jgi:dolichol-phosphate mannosyltransferase
MNSGHRSKKDFLLSIIIPAYNEEGNIQPLLDRLIPVVSKYNYEVIFINDASKDNTEEEIRSAISKDKNIKLLTFIRNFHHQVAITAGYKHAQGDAVVTIDADLQDPPELIEDMVQAWLKGSDVVYAQRTIRKESFFKTFTAFTFYRLIDLLSDTTIPQNVGDFRLVDRKVVDMLNAMPEKARFIRGLVAWGGFKTSYVRFERHQRTVGQTNYPFKKMLSFALDGIVSFSIKPLRFATYMGFAAASMGIVGIMYAVYRRLFLPHEYWIEGWTAMFVGVMFFGGVQLLTIGIIGEYIGRIYTQLQNRPDYLIKEKINF